MATSETSFERAIAYNWPDYVIAAGISGECSECTGGEDVDPDDYEALQAYDEGGFSWSECDSCSSRLGGDRHNAHAIHKNAFGPDALGAPDGLPDVVHLDICGDCLCYHANGDIPDNWER